MSFPDVTFSSTKWSFFGQNPAGNRPELPGKASKPVLVVWNRFFDPKLTLDYQGLHESGLETFYGQNKIKKLFFCMTDFDGISQKHSTDMIFEMLPTEISTHIIFSQKLICRRVHD